MEEIANFTGDQKVLNMPNLDGLTVKLIYECGELVEMATRGDCGEDEDIPHDKNDA